MATVFASTTHTSTTSPSSLLTSRLPPLPRPSSPSTRLHPSRRPIIIITLCSSTPPCFHATNNTRRHIALVGLTGLLFLTPPLPPAQANIEDDYKFETQKIIQQVRDTVSLDKNDPSKSQAVKALRQSSNQWVAKYRREKRFAGKPSYGNMYSVLNAVSGHYISYGDGAPIPTKRKTLILEEVDQAERALTRGR